MPSETPNSSQEQPREVHGATARLGVCPPELFAAVYDRLRAIAETRMTSERAGHTLQATALVHEAYLRLMATPGVSFTSPRHFYGAAAESMRRILIDHARKRSSLKRGGPAPRLELNDADAPDLPNQETLLALDEALTRLRAQDERMHELVMLRYFAGQTTERAAEILGISPRTAKREWAVARAWLRAQLLGQGATE